MIKIVKQHANFTRFYFAILSGIYIIYSDRSESEDQIFPRTKI